MRRADVHWYRELDGIGASRRRRRLTYALLVSLLLSGTTFARAQDETPPFGPNRGGLEELRPPHWTERARDLERRFFETNAWTFYHALADLPSDMRALLSRVAGSDVVGPGEDVDLGDVARHPGRIQHLYTAVTDDIGVIVWYSGGWSVTAHAALYDRNLKGGCRYNLGSARTAGLLPINPTLRMWIQMRGLSQGGCEYVSL